MGLQKKERIERERGCARKISRQRRKGGQLNLNVICAYKKADARAL